MKKTILLLLSLLVGCVHPSNKLVFKTNGPIPTTNSVAKPKVSLTNFTVPTPDTFVVIDSAGGNTTATVQLLANTLTLTVAPVYGAVNILCSTNVNGPWAQIAQVTSNSLIKVVTNGPLLFFQAQYAVLDVNLSWSASLSTNVAGYSLWYTSDTNQINGWDSNTNTFMHSYQVSNVTNACISIIGTNITPIIYFTVSAYNSSGNGSNSNIAVFSVPTPVIQLH